MTKIGKLFATSAIAIAAPLASQAQDITLKIAYPYALNHYLAEHGLKVWTEEVARLTDGAVAFEWYPAYQLGKAQVSLLQTGLADISMLSPSEETSLMPLSGVFELPGFIEGACSGAKAFNEIGRPGGILDQQEFQPLGVRLLYTNMLPPYALFMANKPIKTVEDMAGVKLRANGAAVGETMRALDAVPVTLASADMYDSLSRGTIDGAFFPHAGIAPYSLQEVLNYMTEGVALGGSASLVAISENTWQSLPPDVQKAMEEASLTAQENLCQWLDADAAATRDRLVSEEGIEHTLITPEEAERWYARIGGVVDAWTKQMSSLGKDGQAIVDAFRAAGES